MLFFFFGKVRFGGELTDRSAKHRQTSPREAAHKTGKKQSVLLCSKLNKTVFGYFHLENAFLDEGNDFQGELTDVFSAKTEALEAICPSHLA